MFLDGCMKDMLICNNSLSFYKSMIDLFHLNFVGSYHASYIVKYPKNGYPHVVRDPQHSHLNLLE
jgi:hypothetical protein